MSDCTKNRQTARSARQCCEACYQNRKNLWINGLFPGRFEVGKRAGSKGRTGPLRRPQAFPETLVSKPSKPANAAVPAFLAFPALLPLSSACIFLMNKQADAPQRASMLRRALSIQEKIVDKSGLFGPFRAVLKWARRFSGLALFGREYRVAQLFFLCGKAAKAKAAPQRHLLLPRPAPAGRSNCPINQQTARSARQCCEGRYQFGRNLWISLAFPGLSQVGRPFFGRRQDASGKECPCGFPFSASPPGRFGLPVE